jgi:hypothetical protein
MLARRSALKPIKIGSGADKAIESEAFLNRSIFNRPRHAEPANLSAAMIGDRAATVVRSLHQPERN